MEFLRSFLRRHFAGKPVVASRNGACFLGLRVLKPAILFYQREPRGTCTNHSDVCYLSQHFFIFILQIKTVDLSNSADCLSKFKSSKWLGLLLFAGIVGGTVLKESSNSKNEERKA